MKALRRSQTATATSSSSSSSSLVTKNSSGSPSSSSAAASSWIHLRSLVVVIAASSAAQDRGNPKSPWSIRKRKRAFTQHQWKSLFTPDGKLRDGGVKFLKKVRSGGIDPSIRAEVWPFLLGVYDLTSTEAERSTIVLQKREEYQKLRRRCKQLPKNSYGDKEMKGTGEVIYDRSSYSSDGPDSTDFEDVFSSRPSFSIEEVSPDTHVDALAPKFCNIGEIPGEDESIITHVDESQVHVESSGTDSSSEEETESWLMSTADGNIDLDPKYINDAYLEAVTIENFATWQRIIRLDAIRANVEWIMYSPTQSSVSEEKAQELAVSVGLNDYDHLEPFGIYHATRLVAILEAYALYDPEIGYCQGMSDLLSPILAVMEEDGEAFWCFVGFMSKARHNFRLDEVGIRRQLNIVSKIIKSKDSHLYKHLENLQAEDCFFVYRMVVVLFRRELDFEQTLCLWEVMWADQAAIRAGIGKSAWGIIRLRAPPTDDLLLYAIAACVLQRRKLIVESYSSMDEIIRECNNMAGNLDVWKLLDDAHDLVVSLHSKI